MTSLHGWFSTFVVGCLVLDWGLFTLSFSDWLYLCLRHRLNLLFSWLLLIDWLFFNSCRLLILLLFCWCLLSWLITFDRLCLFHRSLWLLFSLSRLFHAWLLVHLVHDWLLHAVHIIHGIHSWLLHHLLLICHLLELTFHL